MTFYIKYISLSLQIKKLIIMLVIAILSIVFAVSYGISAYLAKRIVVKNSELELDDKKQLLTFVAFFFQWFVIGFPCTVLSLEPIETFWIGKLLAVIEIGSFILNIYGIVKVLGNELYKKVYFSGKSSNHKLEICSMFFCLIMIVLVILFMCLNCL